VVNGSYSHGLKIPVQGTVFLKTYFPFNVAFGATNRFPGPFNSKVSPVLLVPKALVGSFSGSFPLTKFWELPKFYLIPSQVPF